MINDLSERFRKIIPFIKYTSCGNNFVIIDETNEQFLSESDKSVFAYYATNPCFGIGCDNLLIIQRCQPDTLAAINKHHRYWKTTPRLNAQYIFRMFEPTGTEAYCCGNGLLSIADYLFRQYGIDETAIVTEIPLAEPNVMKIGATSTSTLSWVNMGYPRRLPVGLIDNVISTSQNGYIDYLPEIKITFRNYDLMPFTDKTSLNLSTYLVFTGEPHLVIIPDQGMDVPEIREAVFTSPLDSIEKAKMVEKRANFGSWLLHHIGLYINRHYCHLFPAGINVNVVRMKEDNLEYRCFERGINRETLACGTGALAVSYVMRAIGVLRTREISVLPFRCRWYDEDAILRVVETENGWLLGGSPNYLFQGTFNYYPHAIKKNRELIEQAKSLQAKLSSGQPQNLDETIEGDESNRSEVKGNQSPQVIRILIVEDNPKDAKLLKAYLSGGDFELLFANNGKQALEILDDRDVDLILLDVMLPDTNGYKVCQIIKESPATRHVPVIFTTSLSDLSSRINGIKAESDAYLVKPYNPKELNALIEVQLKKKKYLEALTANYEPSMRSAVEDGGYLRHKDEDTKPRFT